MLIVLRIWIHTKKFWTLNTGNSRQSYHRKGNNSEMEVTDIIRVSDPYSFFTDPDPDPEDPDGSQYGSGSGSNPDPGL
jgi:hypothetical protein